MGVGVTITLEGLDIVSAKVAGLGALDKAALMDALGRLGGEQTKRRIASEKRSPAGRAWPKNIEGGSILFKTGSHLHDSIDHTSGADHAQWGSGWIGARVHQFGAVIRPVNARKLAFSIGGKSVFADQVMIPARPYLGVSADNRIEFEKTALRFIERTVQ